MTERFDFREWYYDWLNTLRGAQATNFEGMLDAFLKGREVERQESATKIVVSCNGEFHMMLLQNAMKTCGVCGSVLVEEKIDG